MKLLPAGSSSSALVRRISRLSTWGTSPPAEETLPARRPEGGRGPLPLDEDDLDLVPLLRSAGNEMLEPLVRCILEKGGKTAQLPTTAAFRQHYPDHRKYADDIAAEIQKFGANTFASQLFRSGKGIRYANIVKNLAKRLRVHQFFRSVEDIENAIVAKILSDAWQTMSAEQRRVLIDSIEIRKVKGAGVPATVLALQSAILAGGVPAYQATVIVAGSAASVVMGHGLTAGGSAALAKAVGVFAGPIGWALSALLAANVFAGPAYRVVLPCVLWVALIRKSQPRKRWIERHWYWLALGAAVAGIVAWMLTTLHH